jgi:hypothetical protein
MRKLPLIYPERLYGVKILKIEAIEIHIWAPLNKNLFYYFFALSMVYFAGSIKLNW